MNAAPVLALGSVLVLISAIIGITVLGALGKLDAAVDASLFSAIIATFTGGTVGFHVGRLSNGNGSSAKDNASP